MSIQINIVEIGKPGHKTYTFKDGNISFRRFLKDHSSQIVLTQEGRIVKDILKVKLKDVPLALIRKIYTPKTKAIETIGELIEQFDITEEELSEHWR